VDRFDVIIIIERYWESLVLLAQSLHIPVEYLYAPSENISKKCRLIAKQLHPARKIEIQLLEAISSNSTNENKNELCWESVWNSVPFRLKQFYVQSGNSLLWNRAVSRKIRKNEVEEYQEFIGNNQTEYLDDLLDILTTVVPVEERKTEKVEDRFTNLKRIGLGISTVSGRRKIIEHPSKCRLSGEDTLIFALPKSSYATMFLREVSRDQITQ